MIDQVSELINSLGGYGAYVEYFLPVRSLGATSGQADTSDKSPPKDNLSWCRVVLDG